ncbi:MAG: class I SAM-dependent methyltransferase [Burkholderiales bacterium]
MYAIVRTVAIVLAFAAASAFAQMAAPPQYGDEIYKPNMGQAGKDVIWIPTPDSLVTKMLQAARTGENDVVYDLGAGEGKIPIAAARDFKARAVGIEYNPDMAALAKRNAERAGVADKVKIIAGDIFQNDFSEATVLTLYLLPELNYKLRPQILKMKPGTRVVSHAFNMRDWEPDDVIYEGEREAYLWIVPATISGRWEITQNGGGFKGTLDLIQAFQRVGGTMVMGKQSAPLLGPRLNGNNFSFSFIHTDGAMRSVRGKFDGESFEGWMRLEGYDTPVSGKRLAATPRKA